MPRAVREGEGEDELLRVIVREMPDLTNTELTEEFRARTRRDKLEPRIQQLRAAFTALQPKLDPKKLVFIDEAGSQIGMTPLYARSPRGKRVQDHVPRNRGTVTTMIGALDCDGIRAMMTIEGGTDTDVFEAFVDDVLVPTLSPDDVVVLDNLGAHKPTCIREKIEAAGAKVIFLPPYSPEFNPIELAWSKIKGLLRTLGARTKSDLDWAIGIALQAVTHSDAKGWFRHCGYSVPA